MQLDCLFQASASIETVVDFSMADFDVICNMFDSNMFDNCDPYNIIYFDLK